MIADCDRIKNRNWLRNYMNKKWKLNLPLEEECDESRARNKT